MRQLVDTFFRARSIVNHHIESYNDFLPTPDNPNSKMQQVVDAIAMGEVGTEKGLIRLDPSRTDQDTIDIRLGKINVKSPMVREADGSVQENLTPMEARLRDITYKAPIYLEFTVIENGVEREPEKVHIGDLPVMVKSKKCSIHRHNIANGKPLAPEEYHEKLIGMGEDPIDPGGYFIIGGGERVLISLEDLAPNRVMVEFNEQYGRKIQVAKVFSQREGYRALTRVEVKKDGMLMVSVPNAPSKIPLVIMMKALGMGTDQEIAETIVSHPKMQLIVLANIETCRTEYEIESVEDAINFLEKRFATGQAKEYRVKKVQSILERTLLPHLGAQSEDRKKKAIFLGRVARAVLELYLGLRKEDDKDHYANKRIKLAGDLMENLYRVAFSNLMKDLKYQVERGYTKKKQVKVSSAIRPDVLSQKLYHALATGNWVGGRAGVSQLLDRTCHMSTISHLRRVTSPLARSQPHFEARDLHPTQWGRLCPNETPEGQNCGLVKNYALLVDISVGYDEDRLVPILYEEFGVRTLEEGDEHKETKTYVNGNLIGLIRDPHKLMVNIREQRRTQNVAVPPAKSSEVNLHYDESTNEIFINCDEGRVRRPLIVVKNGKSMLTKSILKKVESGELEQDDLIAMGVVEWIDAEEEEDTYIALRKEDIGKDTTHVEIDPMSILGVCAGLVPFSEHNSSPRNTMGAAMAKQSLGLSTSNFRSRPDTRQHVLHYPEKPMVGTKFMDFVNYRNRPGGQNLVVAVMSFHGYNMEDALIMNKSSVDRGLARSTFLRTYTAEERRYPGGQLDKFEVPDHNVRGARAEDAYKNLDYEDGLIRPEVGVKGGDVMIGKTSPPRFLEEPTDLMTPQKRRETSITVRPSEKGWIDSMMLTINENGARLVKVKVRDPRTPGVGDKFASRHGQKGVVGLMLRSEQMPFTESGIIPDLVANPHAIPSRMTVGHVLELIGGKVGSMEGRFVDGTSFGGEPEEELRQGLINAGFKHSGKEVMYNPQTGHMFHADIFTGVIYYQKLHHMVAGKAHVRSRGPVQILTRQPTEGRARQGGLRFGEMERDTLIAHGAAMVIKDRLLDESDRTVLYVCDKCGHIAMLDRRGYLRCQVCGPHSNIHPVETSYAFKLMLDELKSLGVIMRLRLGDVK